VDGTVAGAVSHLRQAAEGPRLRGSLRVTEVQNDRRKGIRRTTIILVAVALAFYLGFILIGVLRA
jgi:hypothetical protein